MQVKEFLPPVRDKRVEALKSVFSDFISDRISSKEFDGMCYRWAYYYALKDMKPRPLPDSGEDISEFLKLSLRKRRKIFADDTLFRDKVVRFRGKQIATLAHNRNQRKWLKRMVRFFKEKNEMEKVKGVEEVLCLYRNLSNTENTAGKR
jgi:hypothetical protein